MKKYEVYATRPVEPIFIGAFETAKQIYNKFQEEYFRNNRTIHIRIQNSYHWETVHQHKYFGYTAVNPDNGKEYFVIDYDHPYND